ncbi:MAG: hypothetical protein U0X39_01505 [Bacteroidales bacterium]
MSTQNGGVKTKQQMADEYGVCRKTFNKLLQRKNIKLDKGLIYPKEQMQIYSELGEPGHFRKFPVIPKNSL